MPSESFRVSTLHPEQGRSWGILRVDDGVVALDSLTGKRLVTHTHGPVTLVTARLAPPWWRTALILRGDLAPGEIRAYGAGLLGSNAARVRDAVTEAGFVLVNRETRFWRYPRSSFRAR